MDCLFCKIAKNEIPVNKIYEDDLVAAFNDINPVAPIHALIIPKIHITSVLELEEAHSELLGHIFAVINKLAVDLGLSKDGFRIVTNCGENGGQSIPHLHFHLIGGRNMQWPPG